MTKLTDEVEQFLKESLEKHNRFMRRETQDCPHCGKHVESVRQVGRCIYASCGCRVCQGRVPDVWKDERASDK